MVRSCKLGATGLVICVMLLLGGRARADESPDEVLQGKGLVKAGNLYLIEADAKLPESLKAFRAAKKQADEDDRKRVELEGNIRMAKGAMAQWEQEYRVQNEKLGNATDAFAHNQIVGKINALVSKLKEGHEIEQKWEADLAKLGTSRDAYVTALLDVGGKFDQIAKAYPELAADPAVKAALDKINEKARPKLKLGPSVEYTSNQFQINKQRTAIKSDVIPLISEGQVHSVSVNFNGKLTRSLTLDSGASFVCLTADTAKMLDMVPGPDAEVMHMQMADGKLVDARRMVIKSVRVGSFVVENVECAVLPADLVAADNLLGGSFLKNFIYKIDPQANELHLSRIGDKSAPAVTAGAPAGTTAGTTDKKPPAATVTPPAAPAGGNPLDRKPASDNPLDKKGS